MSIERLMSRFPVTVRMDDSLEHVKNIFERERFHHLLVVEDNTLVGVLSDRDLFKALSPRLETASETSKDKACLHRRVHQIMTRELLTLTPEADLTDAIHLLTKHPVSCIPVVNEHNKPLGILTWRDILRIIEQYIHRKNQTRETDK